MHVELIKYPTDEDWMLVKECTLVTIGKEAKTPPTAEWKRQILEARHSPIRELKFVFRITDIPYWVAMHLVRHHVGFQPYIKTQRNDRQDDYNRADAPQSAPIDAIFSMNAEALMIIANKRLCKNAAIDTQKTVRLMCDEVLKNCKEFEGLLVPMCVYNGGRCHEMFPCKSLD